MTDEVEHVWNLIYIQASCPQKPLSKHNNNRGSVDEHKTAFVFFICKGTSITIISESFENISQTGHVKTLTHQTLWCYWDWCGIQHSVCLPNAHPSYTSLHTHTHTQVKGWCNFLLPAKPTRAQRKPVTYCQPSSTSFCIISKCLNEHLLCGQTFLPSSSIANTMLCTNWLHSLAVYYQCANKELNIDSDPSHKHTHIRFVQCKV